MMLIPGPVEVSPEVLKASAYVVNHRSKDFKDIVHNSEMLLNRFADANHSVMTTGSGTLAVESMIYSLTKPGEHVLAVSFGEFGDRMMESVERRGCILSRLTKNEQDSIETSEILNYLSTHSEIETICLVHNETGNGTSIKNLKEITSACKKMGLKVLVDSVSGFASLPIMVNNWGIDAMATCSQKGIASVPGVGIVCLGKDYSDCESFHNDIPKYLDLSSGIKFLKKSETPFTPSTGSLNALFVALLALERETLEKRLLRHHVVADFIRNGIMLSGAKVLGNESNYSDSVIAFEPTIPPSELRLKLKYENIEVAGGMGSLQNKIIRLGNMGILTGLKASFFLQKYSFILGKNIENIEEQIPLNSSIDS